jgi:hypothetical protein
MDRFAHDRRECISICLAASARLPWLISLRLACRCFASKTAGEAAERRRPVKKRAAA